MSAVNRIIVDVSQQKLFALNSQQQVLLEYAVSTSRYGVGNQDGSFKTPLGEHSIAQKIGDGCAREEVFIGRQPRGLLSELQAAGTNLPDDIITARILRLQGLEPGINLGDGIDSYQRYIYIHGTADEASIGQPASHGCVRMRNDDVIELFDQVEAGCRVSIHA